MEQKKILFADDDPEIREVLRLILGGEGYDVVEAEDGQQVLDKLDNTVDLVILDVMMPGMNGYAACAEIRKTSTVPVLFLTARSQDSDLTMGFSAGGDDYLVKPFSLDELMARVRVLTRTAHGGSRNILEIDDLTLDIGSREVTRGGKRISLSAKEYQLLAYLMHNQGIVLSREKIENHIWNFDYEGGTNVVDVYISYLRKKIDGGQARKLIHTVRGVGYVMRAE